MEGVTRRRIRLYGRVIQDVESNVAMRRFSFMVLDLFEIFVFSAKSNTKKVNSCSRKWAWRNISLTPHTILATAVICSSKALALELLVSFNAHRRSADHQSGVQA